MARNVTNEVNAYEEDIERVVGIYAPHLGSELIHVTRTAEWRIVPKLLAVEPLTLKNGIAAPRSPVNNCGKLTGDGELVMTSILSEQAAEMLNLVDDEVVAWDNHQNGGSWMHFPEDQRSYMMKRKFALESLRDFKIFHLLEDLIK